MTIKILVKNASDSIGTYQEAISLSGNALLQQNYIKPEYIHACIGREKEYPTGLLFESGNGIAIPHASSEWVNENSICLVRLANDIEFGRMDDASLVVNCQLMFNLAMASGEEHLSILRKLIKLLQNDTFVNHSQSMSCDDAVKYITESLTL